MLDIHWGVLPEWIVMVELGFATNHQSQAFKLKKKKKGAGGVGMGREWKEGMEESATSLFLYKCQPLKIDHSGFQDLLLEH